MRSGSVMSYGVAVGIGQSPFPHTHDRLLRALRTLDLRPPTRTEGGITIRLDANDADRLADLLERL